VAEVRIAERELGRARAALDRAAEHLGTMDAIARHAETRLAERSAEERALAARLAESRRRLRDLAVAQYLMGGSTGPSVHYLARARNLEDLARRGAFLSSASDYHRSAAAVHERTKKATSDQIHAEVRALEQANANRSQAAAELQAASELVRVRSAEVNHRRLLLDVANAAAPVGPTDIPRLFFDAYRKAAGTLRREKPTCRLSWTAIAAIGKVESDHGRFRGGQLGLNGDLLPPIVGIRLDGTRSAAITDTDGGQLDGDTAYDRAVGPMQFIPSTWAQMARDGNADGVSNAHNAYDAAAGTAQYLCRAVPDGRLDLEEGLRSAFFSYNRSLTYVDTVLVWLRAYDAVADKIL
jgi:membrane-bound lytic murein transglycosylase B